MQFLIENSYFTVGAVHLPLIVDIPVIIDHAPFGGNLYLQTYESKYVSILIKTKKLIGRPFHSTF